jgi:hypothetical protein
MARLRSLREAVDVVPVVLSDRSAYQFDIDRAVPKGFRPATLEEVVLNWRHNPKFGQELGKVLQLWTATMRLPGTHEHEISDDGTLISLRNDRDRFLQLPPERAVFLHPNGSNSRRLAVGVGLGSGARILEVAVNLPSTVKLRVACVKVDQEKEEAAIDARRDRGPRGFCGT